MSGYLLLTGATGLVGRYLMRDLLSRGHRLAVLARHGGGVTVEERVEGILQFFERGSPNLLPRPVVLEGDVTEPLVGLSAADRKWVREHCDRLLHNAATLTFYGSDRTGEPWRTNVGGTRNALECCRKTGIGKLHYVSTAYVCGRREGTIREDELDCSQAFRNDYEQSKFIAERMVRDADFLDQCTIYRPSVITGDSKSGYTSTYHGLHMYLKLMSLLVWNVEPGPDGRRHTPVRLNLTGEERRNIVPVDWITAVMCRLIETPRAHGKTFHLAPREPLTPRQIIEAGYHYFNSYGVEFCGPSPNASIVSNRMEEAAQQNKEIYQPYETTDPIFDTTNTLEFTADIPCPTIDETMLHAFWRYGEADSWGKRRRPGPSVALWVRDQLRSNAAIGRHTAREYCPHPKPASIVGLDVAGPGGGQWQLVLVGPRLHEVHRGLPAEPPAIVRITTDTWQQLCEMSQEEAVGHLKEHVRRFDGSSIQTVAENLVRAIWKNKCQGPFAETA